MRRGFSLLELAMVVAISGLMLGYVLKANTSSNNADCYVSTKVQLNVIRNAIETFARKNDRLPLPAARNVGIESTTYGRESSGANIDAAGGASWGAVPFQALGLPATFAGDCWGNKFTYVVTTALTTNASSGGFLDATVLGNITQKTTTTVNFSTTTAYAVISHGEDGLGAVKLNYSAANPTHGWCAGATLKHLNCSVSGAVIGAGVFNNGGNAGTAYFDDLVVAAGKPQILVTATSNVYCWGDNTYGQIGDGTTTARAAPTNVSLPTGVTKFIQVVTGDAHSCAIGDNGKTYCWGYGASGQLGTGSTANASTPTLVTGGYTFQSLSAGLNTTCGVTTGGTRYCWGDNSQGQLGDATYANRSSPTAVNGAGTYRTISAGGYRACSVNTAGAAHCWGYGQLGDGTNSSSLTPIAVNGGYTFAKVAAGYLYSCGITTGGAAYCWGNNGNGQIGDNTTNAAPSPVASVGGLTFTDIMADNNHTCALTSAGAAYCWGYNNNSEVGDGTTTERWAPTAVGGGHVFTSLASGSYHDHQCGTESNGKVYCWGYNTDGRLGDGTTSTPTTPVLVTGTGTAPLQFDQVATGNQHTCARKPLAPVAWGENGNGQVGDGTTTTRTSPVYMTMPTGVDYFTFVSSGKGVLGPNPNTNRCAITNTGKAYCTGANSVGQIGNGTTGADVNTLTAVTMPGGVTFTKMSVGHIGSCGIGTDNKPYCWGIGYYTGCNCTTYAPVLRNVPSTTVLDVMQWQNGGMMLGSDGKPYGYALNWSDPWLWSALPGGVTSLKAAETGAHGWCYLGNDDQIYCSGTVENYDTIGDSSTLDSTWRYNVPVALPAGVTSWKSLSVGEAFSGHNIACAIGNNDWVYCWGYNGLGLVGDGSATQMIYVPTAVAATTGVTGFTNLFVGDFIVTAMGNNGVAYYWGALTGPNNVGSIVRQPTPVPLPAGASGYKFIRGRSGLIK